MAPAEVVARAATAGVELLALSDHDTVAGVDEALRAGAEHGVTVVPAVEISAVHGDPEELHILGYCVDHHDPALLARLEDWRADRATRADTLATLLRAEGFAIDGDVLEARRAQGLPIGRPHLAQAVFAHPDNAARLQAEELASATDVLVAYLIPGRPAYRPRTRPTVSEAIAAIHDAGGVAVWAHPFWDVDAGDEVLATIDRYADEGLDGVEVFYVTHTREQTLLLADHCAARGLLQTGSADFHGPSHDHFARFLAFELHGREPVLGPIAQAASSRSSR